MFHLMKDKQMISLKDLNKVNALCVPKHCHKIFNNRRI